MKLLLLIAVLTFVGINICEAVSLPPPVPTCWGETCVPDCEPGTHVYSTGCDYLTPQATCDEPNPQPETEGMTCDFMDCYCNEPTVRDTVTNKCVPLDKCTKPKPDDNKQ